MVFRSVNYRRLSLLEIYAFIQNSESAYQFIYPIFLYALPWELNLSEKWKRETFFPQIIN